MLAPHTPWFQYLSPYRFSVCSNTKLEITGKQIGPHEFVSNVCGDGDNERNYFDFVLINAETFKYGSVTCWRGDNHSLAENRFDKVFLSKFRLCIFHTCSWASIRQCNEIFLAAIATCTPFKFEIISSNSIITFNQFHRIQNLFHWNLFHNVCGPLLTTQHIFHWTHFQINKEICFRFGYVVRAIR